MRRDAPFLLTPTVVLTYTYNDLGLLAHTTVTMGGVVDTVTDYFYNGFGLVSSIQQHGVTGGNAVAEKRVDYTYDDAGQWDTITRYANLAGTDLVFTADYDYDFAGRLTSLVYTKGQITLVEHGWTFDEGNRMTQYENWLDYETTTVDYTNDDAGQLTDADYSDQNLDDENYVYDENGNRITANGDTYVTGDNNQLLSDGVYHYVYDDEGNRTLRYVDNLLQGTQDVLDSYDTDITEYAWDYRNRLTTVEHFATQALYLTGTSDQLVEYTYDFQNRLIHKTLDPDGTSSSSGTIEQTVYVHAGDQIIAQFDHSGTGDATASDLTHRYLWGTAIDQLMADESVTSLNQISPADDLWPLIDHLGTTRDLATYNTNQDETTIANHRIFDAFGNLTSETTPAVDCLFGFTGCLFDESTNLQNNLNRWYDPAVGRWLSEDPIGFAAEGANLYWYVANGPGIQTDPTGFSGAYQDGGTWYWEWLTTDAEKCEICKATHDAYKDAEKRGKGGTTETDCDKLKAMLVAIEEEIAGRQKYLDLGCDYKKWGDNYTTDKTPKEMEEGHKTEVKEKKEYKKG